MSDTVVTVKFPNTKETYYAIYCGFFGKILEWFDINVSLDENSKKQLSKETFQQLKCDGTAFFDSREEAEKIIELIHNR